MASSKGASPDTPTGIGTVARMVPLAVAITCNCLLWSTVTNIFVPSGLSAMPSPPDPVTIVFVCASVDALKTPAVEGALQQRLTYAEDAAARPGEERKVAAATICATDRMQ